MALSYQFRFTAPATATAGELEAFLKKIERLASKLGFAQTTVLNLASDNPERRKFSRRLVAASDVAADLSAIADTEVLPENEVQARPLTRLKDPAARRRAWHTAFAMAAAEQRPVTARDTEEAVRRLNEPMAALNLRRL